MKDLTRTMENIIQIPVAMGELIDKITILEIKSERISDPEKLRNIRLELDLLSPLRRGLGAGNGELAELTVKLKEVNARIWELEDAIRDCERQGNFGTLFVHTARAIYRTNDERAALKRQINALSGSKIVEEKSYQTY